MTQAGVLRAILLLWTAIFVIWAIASLSAKRTTASAPSEWKSRLALWAVVLSWWLVLRQGNWPGLLAVRFVPEGMPAAYVGLVLTCLGLGFAVWARFSIGNNWDSMVVLKEDHQLVRTGPYSIVRHPIYSGFMLATLGTAVAQGEIGRLLAVPVIVIAWGYKARVEEAFLKQRFGSQYDQYRREVKALIPAVW
jgi:protein-S-isoprenylcysteine O-methyltransferase Ste14